MKSRCIIRATSLSRSFDRDKLQSSGVRNLNLEIGKGDFTMIMGNSGSGKSTLLYLLSGLDRPTTGSVWVGGTAIHTLKETAMALFRRRHIGFVFQDHNLVANLSLKENILIPGYLANKEKGLVQARAHMLMEQLAITALADRLPSQVSGGERQRCSIARALINRPEILMADEPTGSLNSSASEKVLSCFREVHRSGQSVLMVTHNPKSACYGDKILFIKDGALLDSLVFNAESDLEARHSVLLDWLQKQGW